MPAKSFKNTSMNITSPPPEEEGADVEELRFKSPERGAGSSLTDEQFNKVCLDLIDGHSLARVAQINDVGRNLVAAIKDSIRDQVPEWKKRVSAKMGSLMERMVDELESKLESGELNADKLSVHIGILSDKKRDLDGDNVSVIRHEKGDSGANFAENFAAYLQSLPSANGEQLIDDQPQAAPKPLIINNPDDDCPSNVREGGGGDS